jgi:hypothetical protein
MQAENLNYVPFTLAKKKKKKKTVTKHFMTLI